MLKDRGRGRPAAITIGIVAASASTLLLAGPAQAAPSTDCWTHRATTSTTGGCVGSSSGGTTFKVGQSCEGPAGTATTYSRQRYAPPGRSVTAQTSPCPRGSTTVKAFIATNR